MANKSQVSFQAPTTNTDGTPITAALSYVVSIDTMDPPVQAYPVPAGNVAAAVAGLITVSFAELGFKPVANTKYFADVDAADGSNVSVDSASVSFTTDPSVPNAPTGFTVG